MTRDEAVRMLNAIPGKDPEGAHLDAEEIILQLMRDNGFGDVADAWDALVDRCDGFWYA